MEVPAQIVDQRGALLDQTLVVLMDQPDLQVNSSQSRGREVLQAVRERGAGDRERVDRVRLPAGRDMGSRLAIRCGARRATASP